MDRVTDVQTAVEQRLVTMGFGGTDGRPEPVDDPGALAYKVGIAGVPCRCEIRLLRAGSDLDARLAEVEQMKRNGPLGESIVTGTEFVAVTLVRPADGATASDAFPDVLPGALQRLADELWDADTARTLSPASG